MNHAGQRSLLFSLLQLPYQQLFSFVTSRIQPITIKNTETDFSSKPVNQWSCEEEVMRHPAFWTSLPLTGHSLATRPALNNSETAPKTQHRHGSTVKMEKHPVTTRDRLLTSKQAGPEVNAVVTKYYSIFTQL